MREGEERERGGIHVHLRAYYTHNSEYIMHYIVVF